MVIILIRRKTLTDKKSAEERESFLFINLIPYDYDKRTRKTIVAGYL